MNIPDLRKKIDSIDAELVEMINQRAECALEIGRMKEKGTKSIFAPEREKQVLSGVLKNNRGPLSDGSMSAIFREVISACRALEKPITVSYLGPAGTYTHIASILKFGESTDFLPANTIPDVFSAVEHKEANYGVVPVENSTEGIVNHTLDMFLLSDLRICAEIYARISHALLSCGTDVSRIKRVYSRAEAIAQCRNWLSAHLPQVEIIEVSSTTKAAKMCEGYPTSAAVASSLAAKEYGLNIIAQGIEDNPHNRTRFLVVGYSKPEPSGKDKMSVVFSVPHKAGSLYHALKVFDSEGINLSMIESRPTKQMPWEYVFFVDCQGHEKDESVQKALSHLSEMAMFVRVLGSYPEAE
ncbi:MAG: chorismate mutase [Armatimonadetes bacterium RBG_16_58_9]|nr:MAG: chorismate mutase [Armatimonadetes bacterium RBG_16_58_9]